MKAPIETIQLHGRFHMTWSIVMSNRLGDKEANVDLRFLCNTGLALVILTVLIGTISLFQVLTMGPAYLQGPSGYSVDVASVD